MRRKRGKRKFSSHSSRHLFEPQTFAAKCRFSKEQFRITSYTDMPSPGHRSPSRREEGKRGSVNSAQTLARARRPGIHVSACASIRVGKGFHRRLPNTRSRSRLSNCVSVGIDRMQCDFEPMRSKVLNVIVHLLYGLKRGGGSLTNLGTANSQLLQLPKGALKGPTVRLFSACLEAQSTLFNQTLGIA